MKPLNNMDVEEFLDLEEIDLNLPVKNLQVVRQTEKNRSKGFDRRGKVKTVAAAPVQKQADVEFTYHPSRHEEQWLNGSLAEFFEQKWFDDILSMVRGGKEASVYLCKSSATVKNGLVAAKVYRPRMFRNLRKDHLYREGRDPLDIDGKIILDDRSLHAMQQRTGYGKELMHSSWIGHEFKTMEVLYDAGVEIPKPHTSGSNVILMEYIGDELAAAPTLNTVTLESTEARELYQRVVHNIELMLQCNRIHADLSAFNILYWDGGITLIDFPQAINPDQNQNAYRIFSRDITRVCEYFSSQGVKTDPTGLTRTLWKEKGRLINPVIDPRFLDPEKEEDMQVWKKQKIHQE